MGAKVTEVASSHVVTLSHPDVVIDVIRTAAKAVQKTAAAAQRPFWIKPREPKIRCFVKTFRWLG